jgi:hypothetical protein
MKKLSICLVILGLVIGFTPFASAAERHNRGAVVVDTKGTVYFIGESTRYPFPSMEVFTSWGHKPSDIKKAKPGDLALTIGAIAQMNLPIIGHVDEVTTDGIIRGWVMDKANLGGGLPIIRVYYDVPYGTAVSNYNIQTHETDGVYRADVNLAHGVSGNFGFVIYIADQFADGLSHVAYVYGVNSSNTSNPTLLAGSPIEFTGSINPISASGLELITPNGGEELIYGYPEIIDWEDSGYISGTHTYSLYLVDPNGTTFYLIESGITSTYYNWSVGSTKQNNLKYPIAEGYRIQVIRQGDLLGLYDQSDSTFDIVDEYFNPGSPEEKDLLTAVGLTHILEILNDYYTENGRYPQALIDINPEWVFKARPPYGVCTGDINETLYIPANDLKSYSFKFCLGTDYVYNLLADEDDLAELAKYFKKGQTTWSYQDIVAIEKIFIELEESTMSSNNLNVTGSGKVAGISIDNPHKE